MGKGWKRGHAVYCQRAPETANGHELHVIPAKSHGLPQVMGYSQASVEVGGIASVQGGPAPATPKAGSVTVAGAVMVGSEPLVVAEAGAVAGGAVGDASAAAAGAGPGREEPVAAALVAAALVAGPAKPAAAAAAATVPSSAAAAAAVSRGRTSSTPSPHRPLVPVPSLPQEACLGCPHNRAEGALPTEDTEETPGVHLCSGHQTLAGPPLDLRGCKIQGKY